MSSAVSWSVRPDDVAVLTIDQPGRKVNVLTADLLAALESAVGELAGQSSLRGLVIASGKPGTFIAGADLNAFAHAQPHDPAVRRYLESGHRVFFALEDLPFPTCAAIDGAALGGGLELALACRFRIASTHPQVRLGFPELQFGLIPGWGGTQRLPRIVGHDAALRLIASGEILNASQAVAMGLVTEVVSGESLMDAAVRRVLAGVGGVWPSSQAADALHRLMAATRTLGLRDGIARETETFLTLVGSEESRTKIAAFFAARGK